MRLTFAAFGVVLTIAASSAAGATTIAATPCATSASVERGTEAVASFLHAPAAAGVVLLDCRVQSDQKLQCVAPNHTESQYDLSGAALAFASELEVCPGTPRHLMFPLVFRPDGASISSPSP